MSFPQSPLSLSVSLALLLSLSFIPLYVVYAVRENLRVRLMHTERRDAISSTLDTRLRAKPLSHAWLAAPPLL